MHLFPWILSIIGVTAMLMVGGKHWHGWVIAFANECLWVAYALATNQKGFIFGAIIYGTANLRNAYVWAVKEGGLHDKYSRYSR